MSYDTLLLAAIWMAAAAPFVLAAAYWDLAADAVLRLVFQVYLLSVSYLFFAWFWIHGGQTLGMRSWRLRLVRDGGGPITWRLAFLRYAAALLSLAPLGLGYWWVLLDKRGLSWHDRLSGTRLSLTPKT